jgi:hypothetical protein
VSPLATPKEIPMSKRILVPLVGLSLAFTLTAGRAQDDKVKDPESRHGLTLRVRTGTEDEFVKATKRYGVEVYQDMNNSNGIYISETGSLASVAGKMFKPGDGKGREPLFRHGLRLNARPAGEKDWDRSKKFGLEVFKDETGGNLVYINQSGDIDVVPGAVANDTVVKGKPKNPTWRYAFDLKVRKVGEKDFNKDTRKVSVEVFRDENNGNLVYLAETGSFAVVAGKLTSGDATGKEPDWKYGLDLKVRKAAEREFTKDTKQYGLEVFLDENNGTLIYITEAGNIACVPGKLAKAIEGKSKGPELKHAMDLQVRKAGEKDFGKDSKRFGVEAYADETTGNLIYISETGDISVVSAKSE